MPVYALDKDLWFPEPRLSSEDGLLAIGGELSANRLLLAYSNGIFPWYSQGEPIMWWSPDPRMILFPKDFKRSKSLKQSQRNKNFMVSFDNNFEEVINQCSAMPRKGQEGTWITEEMKKAFINLHIKGYAHSVETYLENKLVGGLYGISLGKAFLGESMFHLTNDASKIAFHALVEKLKVWDFHFIDAQVETEHLRSLGAKNIPRHKYLELLYKALKYQTKKGKW